MKKFMVLFIILCGIIIVSPVEAAFYRGNIHTHTNYSDGADTLENVSNWYSTRGYDFLVSSDHGLVTDLSAFNTTTFLTMNGEEYAIGGHIVFINTSTNSSGTLSSAINNATLSGGIAIMAHPDFIAVPWSNEILLTTKNYNGIEIHNAVTNNISTVKWDNVLMTGKKIYGFAVDDVHNTTIHAGKGWIMVNSTNLNNESILTAIRNGDFYAVKGNYSTGKIIDMNILPFSINGNKMGTSVKIINGVASSSITVNSSETIINIQLIRINSSSSIVIAQKTDCASTTCTWNYNIPSSMIETAAYRLSATTTNTQIWSNPIWIDTNKYTLNGSVFNGDSVSLNYRNASDLNMSGLVAAWGFNTNSGMVAYSAMNESGTNNVSLQGTLINMNIGVNNCTGNCSGWNTSGRIGNVIVFDGVNDYVSVMDHSELRLSDGRAFTLSSWIKTAPTTINQGIVRKGSGYSGGGGYDLLIKTNRINFRTGGATGTDNYLDVPNTADNIWHLITITSNGTYIKIYIDGVERTVSDPLYSPTIGIETSNFDIGKGLTPTYWNGSIDEMKIWNRQLSNSEISVLYNTSMRSQAMPIIYNESANTNYLIKMVKIAYSGQDSINNVSMYSKPNGTTSWELVKSNATPNIWYTLSNQSQYMDFGIELNGNGSSTPFITSLDWLQGRTYTPVVSLDTNVGAGSTNFIPMITIVFIFVIVFAFIYNQVPTHDEQTEAVFKLMILAMVIIGIIAIVTMI